MNTTDAEKRDLETMRDTNYWYDLSTVQFGSFARYMLWFNFIRGLNFIFFCFKIIIIHYHTPKQKKIKLIKDKIEPQHIPHRHRTRRKWWQTKRKVQKRHRHG